MAAGSEPKRDRRKKEQQVARTEEIREDNLKRREEIYTQVWMELSETRDALMSDPPTEINYLLRLHRESLRRENELLAVRVYHDHLMSSARASYEAEVKSIEEEFNNAQTQAREKLLESLEERRKKLRDEKELVDFNEETAGHSHRAHATRGLRNRSSNRSVFSRGSPAPLTNHDHHHQFGSQGDSSNLTPYSATITHEPITIDNDGLLSTSILHGPSTIASPFVTADDPLSMAALNVDPHLRQSPIFQQLLQLGHRNQQSRRGGGRRAPTGLPGPISHTSITPGAWNNFHKSQLGISSVKPDDADADLEEIMKNSGLGNKKRRGPSSSHSNNQHNQKKIRDD